MASRALGPYCAYVAPSLVAMMATAPPTSESAKYGSFSTRSGRHPTRRRRSGYTSSRSRAAGSGTVCGLAPDRGAERCELPRARIERDEICQHHQQEEEAAEHVAPLGDPRDRLGAKRMGA